MLLDTKDLGATGRSFDHHLSLRSVEDRVGESIPVLQSRVLGSLRKGKRGVDLRGSLHAALQLTCSRCLEPMVHFLDTEFFLVLIPPAVEFGAREVQISPEDTVFFCTDAEGFVDLDWMATEQIYLHLPMKPVCSENCRGLCAGCGANLNSEPCACEERPVDPRLAPLLRFRKSQDA